MAGYGQFCPVAKATEVIGEKWTLLVLRELLLGTTRFNDFQRAISRMSPTLLAKRLRHLEECRHHHSQETSGQKGYEYRLTAAGKELAPLIEVLAVWGMRWAREQLTDDELDVEFLMRELQRRLQTEHLPDGETVICLMFDELTKHKTWWLSSTAMLLTCVPRTRAKTSISISIQACARSSKSGRATSTCARRCATGRSRRTVRAILFARCRTGSAFACTKMSGGVTRSLCGKLLNKSEKGAADLDDRAAPALLQSAMVIIY